MAVTAHTLRLLQQMRVELSATVDAATRDLVAAWATAWDELSGAWQGAAAQLVAAAADGAAPTRLQIARASQVARALDATRAVLEQLADGVRIRVSGDLPAVVNDAVLWHARLTASQLPAAAGSHVDLTAGFNRVDPHSLAAVVTRTTQQVTATSWELEPAATAAMKAELVRAVGVGDNPIRAAQRMVARVEGRFNGGLSRALTIARTEVLDAHRAAGFVADQANHDVLAGWVWVAGLSARTCPACWSRHGSQHPVTEAGPHGHQNCRCTRSPVTKSWRDLGFDVDEPVSLIPDGRAAFTALSPTEQLDVMGPARLAGLKDGSIAWGDLATKRSTPGWRDSWAPTPVKALVGTR